MSSRCHSLLSALAAAIVLSACGGGASDGGGNSTVRPFAGSGSEAAPTPPALVGTWSQLPNPNYAPPAGPYGREWTEMTWDSSRRKVVLFGGIGADQYQNDIWSYDTATTNWTQVDPQVTCPGNSGFTKPNGTDDSNFKYDPVNDLYWVFGANSGYRCRSLAPVRTAMDGTAPNVVVDTSLPSSVNNDYAGWHVRVGNTDVPVDAYDAVNKRLLLKGTIPDLASGTDYKLYATTGAGVWYFNPTTRQWVGQDTPAGNTGITPTVARIAPAVAYSDTDAAFVLFGGRNDVADKTVWRLDVRSKLWAQLPVPASDTPPHMRELLNSLVYDKQNDVFILFGGVCSLDDRCPDNTLNGQTWVYRLSTNTWSNMNPPDAPSPRAQQVMAYDEKYGVVTLYGGATDAGIAGDTWYYHYPSNRWTRLAPASPPEPFYRAQVAYDPVNMRTVVFGGQSAQGLRAEILALTLAPSAGAPVVSLTSPAGGTSYVAPAAIPLAASAANTDNSVVKVEFYADATKIGESTSAPYSGTWTNVAAGTYVLTARATDIRGTTTVGPGVTVTVRPSGSNQAPTATLTTPANGSVFMAPADIVVAANASDADGSVAKVEFFANGIKIGETTDAPYSITWSAVSAGNYSVTARATDNNGSTGVSAAVSVYVTSPSGNYSPNVAITAPANGSSYAASSNIALAASASDSDGSVAKVEFFLGTVKLGETTSAPYTFTWTNAVAGSYTVTAVATDNAGATTTSAPVSVTVSDVSSGPSINAALQSNGATVSASSTYSAAFPTASLIDGNRRTTNWANGGGWNDATSSSYPDWVQVNFGTTRTINRINVVTLADNFSTAAEPSATDTFSQYGVTSFDIQYWTGSAWTTVPGGSITGNNLVLRSVSFPAVTTDRIRIVINSALANYSRLAEIEAWTATASSGANAPPEVALTSPASGSSYAASSNIALAASASDSDGSVAKVEFFLGTVKLGETTSAPYTFTWTNAVAGSYTVTAVATDNAGATTTSAPVSVTVSDVSSGPSINAALQSNGATVSASSTYSAAFPTASLIDGNRRTTNWGNGGGWNDATSSSYPDWVQVNFGTTRTINRINVVTLADNFSTAAEPSATDTFSQYGVTSFDIQYWTGSAWTTVPGGSITGNNLVLRSVSFPAVSTDRIRIVINSALANYSRLAEIEAWTATASSGANAPPEVALTSPASGSSYAASSNIALAASASDSDGSVAKVEFFLGTVKLGETTSAPYTFTWTNAVAGSYTMTAVATDNAGATTTSAPVSVTVSDVSSGPSINAALQSNGATVSASSTYSAAFPTASLIDGNRRTTNWANGGGWNDATSSSYPDWVQVNFGTTRTINRINVVTLADNFSTAAEPSATDTFSQYGVTSFDIQYWTGSAWTTVPGGSITGNNLVLRSVSFPAVSTDRIRIVINSALANYSRLAEIEAWTATAQ